MQTVTFRPTWESWCRAARRALAAGLSPSDVVWAPDTPDVQTMLPLSELEGSPRRPAAGTPRSAAHGSHQTLLVELGRHGRLAIHHRSEERFALLYRLLWRARREPGLLDDLLDPDVFRLHRMAAAVREDIKKTRSHLRLRDPSFRPGTARPRAARAGDRRLPDLVAWCEPQHPTLPLLAEDLAARSPDRSFALLSPDLSVFWDGHELDLGAGTRREVAESSERLASCWLSRHVAAA